MYDLRENNKIDGWMSLIELLFLYNKSLEMRIIVELGPYKGRSTFALCSGCKGAVITIDDFSMSDRQTLEKNVGHFNNLKIIESNSSDTQGIEEIDMVFIDADHAYEAVVEDIKAWLPLTKKFICGHDYDLPEVKQAVQETIGEPDEVVGSIWVKWIK